ncbi:hypothetical protein [Paucibacter sp. B51]|uniref:hypothetical protein n=1 Tax=Paucibacter sp. B51 TaxID=2993315 RepID=UPI0022EBB69D|nr:hypothetical protein [Paucibacter sp. B51]
MKTQGMASDFFAALARKAVQAPGLLLRRASRFEEAPAANGPARWGADPAGLAEPGEGEGLGVPARGPSPQLWSGTRADAAPVPQGPVMQALSDAGSSARPALAPSERNLAQRSASAQAPDLEARVQQPWNPVVALSRPQDNGWADASRSLTERRPARDRGQESEAAPQPADSQRGRSTAVTPSRPSRMAALDRLEPAATADDSSASRGPVLPSLASLKLQPLDAVQAPREASLHTLPDRRESAASAHTTRHEAPAPQIEIHIGRIEVLPAGGPASAAAPQPNPSQAHARAPQSLESYLAERRRS